MPVSEVFITLWKHLCVLFFLITFFLQSKYTGIEGGTKKTCQINVATKVLDIFTYYRNWNIEIQFTAAQMPGQELPQY